MSKYYIFNTFLTLIHYSFAGLSSVSSIKFVLMSKKQSNGHATYAHLLHFVYVADQIVIATFSLPLRYGWPSITFSCKDTKCSLLETVPLFPLLFYIYMSSFSLYIGMHQDLSYPGIKLSGHNMAGIYRNRKEVEFSQPI